MKKQTQPTNDPDLLKFENELKKIELSLKTGALFHSNPDSDVPPEIERQFLRHIERFEEAMQSAKNVTIHEIIGKPELKHPDTLSDREISEELKKVNDMLYEHSISLDTICPVDDRTLYTFIKDELMKEETQDMKLPGVMICYIYEEFHPNHEYDIKRVVAAEIRCYLMKTESENEDDELSFLENHTEIRLFTKAFEKFIIHHFNINAVHIEGEKAIVSFEIKFTGFTEITSGKVIFQGKGTAKLEMTDGYWWVSHLYLPV